LKGIRVCQKKVMSTQEGSDEESQDYSEEESVNQQASGDEQVDCPAEFSFVFRTIDQKLKIFKIESTCSLVDFISKFNCITEYCSQDDYEPFFIINSVLYADSPIPNTTHSDLLESLKLLQKPLNTPLNKVGIKNGRKFMYHHSVDCRHEFKTSTMNYPAHVTVLPLCCVCEMDRPTVLVGKDLEGMYTNSLWCKSCFDEFHVGMDTRQIETMDIEWKPL
jgi:hypothetical protein